jgi:phage terminase large subunit-like protein
MRSERRNSCAYNKLQAALIFAEMKAIIEAIPEFEARCNLQRYGKVIEVLSGDGAGSVYESLSADDKRAHGLAPSFWVYDEFAQAPNSDLLNNRRTSMGKRSESLGVVISTQASTDLHPLSQMIRPFICNWPSRQMMQTSTMSTRGLPATKHFANFSI